MNLPHTHGRRVLPVLLVMLFVGVALGFSWRYRATMLVGIAQFPYLHWKLRHVVLEVVAARSSPRAIPALMRFVRDGSAEPEYRGKALFLLGDMAAARVGTNDERVYDFLISFLSDPEIEVRRGAVDGLGAFGDARAVPLVIPLMQDGAAVVRARAAWALGAIGDSSATRSLIAALYDIDEHLAYMAGEALLSIGDDQGREAVIVALTTRPWTDMSTLLGLCSALRLRGIDEPYCFRERE